MTDARKEYIKKIIIKVVRGKVNYEEIHRIRENLMNYSREDWRDLKIMGKELAQEIINEEINKHTEIPDDWKSLIKDFSYSYVNVFFAIFNEEVLYRNMLLQKQSGLDEKTKIIKILPVISQSMDQISARAPSNRPANYWKVEKSLVKKIKKVVGEIKSFGFQALLKGNVDENQMKAKLNKLANIWQSLTVEEMAVLKDKLKIFVNKIIENYAPSSIKNSPEIRQLVNSTMDLCNAVNDEKLCKNFIDIVVKCLKSALQDQQIWKEKNVLVALQKIGMESEVKNLIRNYTQHLNKLAGEGEPNKLSTEKEEDIIKKLTENNPSLPQEDVNLEGVWKDNWLINGLDDAFKGEDRAKIPNQRNLLKDLEDTFLTTQSKPKWYQNPWIIWPLVIGAFVVGGLVVWLLVRRKKEKKIDSRYGY
jgi:hypothetical protein